MAGATIFAIEMAFYTKVLKGQNTASSLKVTPSNYNVAAEVDDDQDDLEAASTQRNGYKPLAVDEDGSRHALRGGSYRTLFPFFLIISVILLLVWRLVLLPTRARPVPCPSTTTEYFIQPGDTCYDIALRHKTSLDKFLIVNPQTDCNSLMPGDRNLTPKPAVIFGLILFFSVIQLAISAWLTSRFDARHDYFSVDERDRTRFILFSSIWTVVVSSVYLLFFFMFPSTVMSSVLSHIVLLVLTWIFWTAGAASITSTLGGGLNCSDTVFAYCGQLNAMEAFAWILWILVTFLVIVVAIRGIMAARRGDGVRGPLLA
ncbi:hypothetical protein ID866_8926 [Astraeus odoratus]|nr:hypothetical protein ID866_8926 [Astraeus odoratus]